MCSKSSRNNQNISLIWSPPEPPPPPFPNLPLQWGRVELKEIACCNLFLILLNYWLWKLIIFYKSTNCKPPLQGIGDGNILCLRTTRTEQNGMNPSLTENTKKEMERLEKKDLAEGPCSRTKWFHRMCSVQNTLNDVSGSSKNCPAVFVSRF